MGLGASLLKNKLSTEPHLRLQTSSQWQGQALTERNAISRCLLHFHGLCSHVTVTPCLSFPCTGWGYSLCFAWLLSEAKSAFCRGFFAPCCTEQERCYTDTVNQEYWANSLPRGYSACDHSHMDTTLWTLGVSKGETHVYKKKPGGRRKRLLPKKTGYPPEATLHPTGLRAADN